MTLRFIWYFQGSDATLLVFRTYLPGAELHDDVVGHKVCSFHCFCGLIAVLLIRKPGTARPYTFFQPVHTLPSSRLLLKRDVRPLWGGALAAMAKALTFIRRSKKDQRLPLRTTEQGPPYC